MFDVNMVSHCYQEIALTESNKSLREQLKLVQEQCRALQLEKEEATKLQLAAEATASAASADLLRLTETFEQQKTQSDLTIKELQVIPYTSF